MSLSLLPVFSPRRYLILLAQNLQECLGHVVWPLLGTVIPLQVLKEAEEERVYTHSKNAEEATGNDIGSHDGGLQETRPIGTPRLLWGCGWGRERCHSP